MKKTPGEYRIYQFFIAKMVFAFFAVLYYHAFLFTIAGFSIGPIDLTTWSMLVYFLFPPFSLISLWLLFLIIREQCEVWWGENRWIGWTIFSIHFCLWIVLNIFHLNLIKGW